MGKCDNWNSLYSTVLISQWRVNLKFGSILPYKAYKSRKWYSETVCHILLEFFKYSTVLTSRPSNIKCMVPAFFGGWFGGKDCGLCTYNGTTHLPKKMDFCMKRRGTKNQKPFAVDVLFLAYPMVPLSCRYVYWPGGTLKIWVHSAKYRMGSRPMGKQRKEGWFWSLGPVCHKQ